MNSTIHRVYWTENNQPQSKDFNSGGVVACLKYCELLRTRRKDGDNISHVTIASEMEECVSLAGVDVTGPEYNWKKRRGGRK